MSQEWKDGKEFIDKSRVEAKEQNKWNFKLKELAVLGSGMMTDAECGVCDVIQHFIVKDSYEKIYNETWKEYINKEFEQVFTDEYKNLNA